MTRKHGVIAGAILLAGVLLAFLALSLWPDLQAGPGITKANFERLKFGMTEAEVDALIGSDGRGPTFATEPPIETRISRAGTIELGFDDDGKLIRMHWIDAQPETLGEQFRRLFPWLVFW